MDRPIPETDHDLMLSLWIYLIGTNGNGLIAKFEDFVKQTEARSEKTNDRLVAIEQQLPRCWTREDHEKAEADYQKRDAKKKERRKLSLRDWALIIGTVVGSLGTIGLFIVAIVLKA